MREKVGIGFASLAVAMFGIAIIAAVNQDPRDAAPEEPAFFVDDPGFDELEAEAPEETPVASPSSAPKRVERIKRASGTSARPASRAPAPARPPAPPPPPPEDVDDNDPPFQEPPGGDGEGGDSGGTGGGNGDGNAGGGSGGDPRPAPGDGEP